MSELYKQENAQQDGTQIQQEEWDKILQIHAENQIKRKVAKESEDADIWREIERLASLYDTREGAVNFKEISLAFTMLGEKRMRDNFEIKPLFDAKEKASIYLKKAKADYDFYFGPESREAKERLEKALHEYEITELAFNRAFK
jgi:hypothetical protein